MSGERRRGAVALAVVVGLAVIAVLVQAGNAETGVTPAPAGALSGSTSAGGIPGRVESQAPVLKAAPLEQTSADLRDWQPSYRAGPYSVDEWDSGRLPLKDEDGASTVRVIHGDGGFLRIYEKLAALPPAQATELINRHFPLWLQQYSEKYAKYVEKGRQVSPASADRAGPGSYIMVGWGRGGPDDDGLPNLECMRWRLLGLVLIAGNLRLQGTAPWVQKVAEEARAQRDYLYQATELSDGFRAHTITTKSLYNRQILGYALVQTSPVPERALAALAATGRGLTVKALSVYDARQRPYDRALIPGPVAHPIGSLAVEYLGAVSDAEFDSIFTAAVAR